MALTQHLVGQDLVTVEQFYRLVEDGQKADLIDGVIYRLMEGHYELTPLENNRIFRSVALAGFWLDVEWLLTYPLPGVYEKLQEILNN